MELIERYNGLGKVAVEGKELESLKRLLTLTDGYQKIDALRCAGYRGEYDPAKAEFHSLMEELFPAFNLGKRKINRTYNVFFGIQDKCYNGINVEESRRISSRLPIARPGFDTTVELNIFVPSNHQEKNHYFMGVALAPSYNPDPVDDIVQLLGSREVPSIEAAAPICFGNDNSTIIQSLADVPRLKEVIRLYGRAATLFDLSAEKIGVTKMDLAILRRDQKEHGNLFVRRGSENIYRQALDDLTNT